MTACRGANGTRVVQALKHFHLKPDQSSKTAASQVATPRFHSLISLWFPIPGTVACCGIRSLAFAHWHSLTGPQVQRVLYSALDEAPVEELVKSIEQVWYCMQLLILNRVHDLLLFRRI